MWWRILAAEEAVVKGDVPVTKEDAHIKYFASEQVIWPIAC